MSKKSKQKDGGSLQKTPSIDVLDLQEEGVEFLIESEEQPIDESEKRKSDTYIRSSHLAEQQLKHFNPNKATHQLTLFESLPESIRDVMEGDEIAETEILAGVQLTSLQSQVVEGLCICLYDRSNTIDATDRSFYAGTGGQAVRYGKGEAIQPTLEISIYDLAKAMYPNDKISGKQMETINKTLLEISNKKYLFRYKEKIGYDKKREENIMEIITDYDNLIKLRRREGVTEKDGKITSLLYKKDLIVLHPIFKRQIDTKFIKVPRDLHKRIVIAHGNARIPEATIQLKLYLLHKLSAQRSRGKNNPEITEKNLLYAIAGNYMQQSRKKLAKQSVTKAIQTMLDIGLLESYDYVDAKTGGKKYVFKLNKNFK